MPSFECRVYWSSVLAESILTYTRTQCFIRKVTYFVSRAPGTSAVEKFGPSVSADVSVAKNAGVYDAKP